MLKAVVLGTGVFNGDYGHFILGGIGTFLFKAQQNRGLDKLQLNTEVRSGDFNEKVKN